MNRIILILIFLFITSCATNIRWVKHKNLDYFSIDTYKEVIDSTYKDLCNVNFPQSNDKKTLTLISYDLAKAGYDASLREDLHWQYQALAYKLFKSVSLYFECGFFESMFSQVNVIKLPLKLKLVDNVPSSFTDFEYSDYTVKNYATDYLIIFHTVENTELKPRITNLKNGKKEMLTTNHIDAGKVLDKDKNNFLREHEYFKDSITLLE
tara:strand:+ start:7380 stop:8006 length:627 start_codon:yes stop_codon:yes gene_type:complete